MTSASATSSNPRSLGSRNSALGAIPAGPAILLVAVAWVFIPADQLPTFDTLKTLVLLIGVTVLSAAAAIRRTSALTRGVAVHENATPDGDPLLLVPFGLVVVALIVTGSAGPRGSLEGPFLALGALAATRLLASTSDGRAAVVALARGASIAALGAGTYAIVQRAGLDPTPWGARSQVTSTFGNTSFAAEFQAAATPFALLLAFGGGRGRGDRMLGGTAAALAAIHLVLAQSRIDLVAVVAAVAIAATYLLAARGRRKAALGLGSTLLASGGVLAMLFAHAAGGGEIPFIGRSDTVAIRTHIWSSFAAMLTEVPLWLPQGAPFVDLYPAFRDAAEFKLSIARTVTTPHNDLMGLTLTLGVAGALTALACALLLVRRLIRAAPGSSDAPYVAATLGCMTALFVSALASSPLTHGATALLGALAWGAALALRPTTRTIWAPERVFVDWGLAIALGIAIIPALGIVRADTFVADARSALAKGELQRALLAYEVAAAADARAHDARHELGTLLHNEHEFEAAEQALRSAALIRPGSARTQANLARTLLAQDRSAEARQILEAGLAACSWHPELLTTRAQFALSEGRGADAVTDFTAAREYLAHEPRIDALIAEARLLAEPGGAGHEFALDVLKDLLERDDRAQVARSVPKMLRRDPSLLPALVATARRLVSAQPEHAAVLVAAAAESPVARADVGFLEEAGAVLTQAGWTDAGSRFTGRALGLRARSAYDRGENERAVRFAQKAGPRDPDPEHYLVMARALARLDQGHAAVEAVGSAAATGRGIDPQAVRADPVLGGLLPDDALELILRRAAKLHGDGQE